MTEASTHEIGSSGESASVRWPLARWAWEWLRSFAVAVLIFMLLRMFVVEAFQIPTGSMENTLLPGDFLLVNKVVYGAELPGTEWKLPALDDPARGEVVVFEPPVSTGRASSMHYIKRVVGIPGDTLSMIDGKLWRNGEAVREPYVKHIRPYSDPMSGRFRWQRSALVRRAHANSLYRPTRDNWGPLVVPGGKYFVLGDNRDDSEDSRYWGFVPREAITGKPLLIYYSYDRDVIEPLSWLTQIRWDRVMASVP